ncbi:MAG: nucleotidyltransferase [Verrucomicrobiota bacterium]
MKDCSKDVLNYHDQRVTLPKPIQDSLRGNRNANRDRLRRGLEKNEHPKPSKFIIQGSYGMKTMKQHPKKDYDIDDGAAFEADNLVNATSDPLTPHQAKERVRDALIAGGGLSTDPVIKRNCVRVDYADGHHVDIPVFRLSNSLWGVEKREFASGDEWKDSDPTGITNWFKTTEKNTHKDGENEPQLRRLVRLLKMYAGNNLGKDALSGLLLTVLAAEVHRIHDSREDNAFRNLLTNVRARLGYNRKVYNPADLSEELTRDRDSGKIDKLIEQIDSSLKTFEILDDPDCTQVEARKAWDKVFKSDFFSELHMDEQAKKVPATPSDSYPNKRVNIQGPGTSA